jgi:hypothetical protein
MESVHECRIQVAGAERHLDHHDRDQFLLRVNPEKRPENARPRVVTVAVTSSTGKATACRQ